MGVKGGYPVGWVSKIDNAPVWATQGRTEYIVKKEGAFSPPFLFLLLSRSLSWFHFLACPLRGRPGLLVSGLGICVVLFSDGRH
jgi:hypothetical protein